MWKSRLETLGGTSEDWNWSIISPCEIVREPRRAPENSAWRESKTPAPRYFSGAKRLDVA